MSTLGNWVQKLPRGPRRHVERLRHTVLVLHSLKGVHPRTCSLCGYEGKFRGFGFPPGFDVQCSRCDSLPRHRLFDLVNRENGLLDGVTSLVHFAPEEILEYKFRKLVPDYRTADLYRDDVDFKVDIEDTGMPGESFEAAFVSHVLEHVDDTRAIAELHRILKAGGILVAMVPIIDAWPRTYENGSVSGERARDLHFGQKDHVRFYGSDFVDRLSVHFDVTQYMATPQECVAYGLDRGERVFVGRKRPASATARPPGP